MTSPVIGKKPVVSSKDLRSFGLIVGSIFLLIGLYPLLKKLPIRYWSLGAGGILVLAAAVWPPILHWPYRLWMKVGHVLGWINTRIILGFIFTIVFTPLGSLQRLFGKDFLGRKPHREKPTYKVEVPPKDPKSMERQF